MRLHRRPERIASGEISMADALTAAGELRCKRSDGFAAIAQALDLVVPGDTLVDRPARRPNPPAAHTERPSESGGTKESVEDVAAESIGTVIGAQMRIEESREPTPTWVGEIDGFEFPVSRRVAIPPQPPLPALQARAAMATVASTRRATQRLNVRELVRRAARLRPFSPPPLLVELRTAPAVQLLIDHGEGMEPYAEDVRFLAAQLADVAGHDRVERRRFVRTPLDGVDPDPFSDVAQLWRPPAAALVIALTDLGAGGPLGSPDRGSAREWWLVAERVVQHGGVLRVLTPFGPDRTPAGLTGIADVIGWDALDELVRLRG